jgi:biopolymer transport protein ExbD
MSVSQDSGTAWDVFHAETLELQRGLSTAAVRAALTGGSIRDDDLVRPAGTTSTWTRLADIPELSAASELGPNQASISELPPSQSRPKSAATPEASPASVGADRTSADRQDSGDLEPRSEDKSPKIEGEPTSQPPKPTWIQLGGDTGDVSFPVLSDRPADREPVEATRPELDPTAVAAWAWADDDDLEEDRDEIPPVEEEFDEQIEILEDELPAGLEILDEDGLTVPSAYARESFSEGGASRVALPVVPSRDWNEDRQPVEGGEEDGDFTLSRSGPMTVEELDLAPMVDVAFQLVLFFMVTATTVLFKTLEIPKPNAEPPPGAVTQGHSRSLDDFKDDYILVEIDTAGTMKIDHEPVAAEMSALAERLRTSREKTGRKAMLLSAEFATPHRHAVLAYDAANEIGLGIAIAKPSSPQAAGPGLITGSGKPAPTQPPTSSELSPVNRK